ncbi:MAG TPA: glycosyltransferase family 4 protein [Candidatus Pacearchaeota archaeon]|nr:glycosyltransferase family 4 protein [Candidatus Pacearchaeota archaeon]
MNILIEGGDLNPPFAEGTRNVAITHAKALIKKGHNVVILTRNKSRINGKKLIKKETIQGIKFYRWSNYFELAFLYQKIIQKEKINLVHFFAKGGRPKIYLNLLKRLGNKPFIFTLLGLPVYSPKKVEKVIIGSLNNVNLGVITSNVLLNKFKKGFKNTIYVPIGIDFDKYTVKKEKRVYVLALRKPTEQTVDAFKRLKKEFPSIKFVFNSSTLDKKDKITEDVLENFEVIGNNERMPDIFNKTLILVDLHDKEFPLRCASPPVAIIEALSCGTTVVSTDMPEIREVITDKKNGYLIDSEKEEEIYTTLKNLLNKKLKKQKISAHSMISKYNINNVIKTYEQLYQKLLTSC